MTTRYLQVPEPPVFAKMVNLPVLSVLTMEVYNTKPPPYDFLNLYGAYLQALRTPKMKYLVEVVDNLPRYERSARESTR
jgi:hypothetical protein